MNDIIQAIDMVAQWYREQYVMMRVWFWIWVALITTLFFAWATKP